MIYSTQCKGFKKFSVLPADFQLSMGKKGMENNYSKVCVLREEG